MSRYRLLTAAFAVIALIPVTSATASAQSAVITRYAGVDRYATSAAIVDANFSPGVPVVYVATGATFPDGLAGGAAATREGGPVLLVEPGAIPTPIATELRRLDPGRIVVLGGTRSISTQVEAALHGYTTGTVTRVAGADRYQTAAALAGSFPAGGNVFLVTGENFPDALAATAAAASEGAPILLTERDALPAATAHALSVLKPSLVTIAGSTNVVSDDVVHALAKYTGGATVWRVYGVDRFDTAAGLAAQFQSPRGVFIAPGDDFADALAAGPVAGSKGEPLLLSPGTCLEPTTMDALAGIQPESVTLLGGSARLADTVGALAPCVKQPVPLPCTAAMSDPNPPLNSTTTAVVTTYPGATAVATAHFQNATVPFNGQADASGNARVNFYIADPQPVGYTVAVDVTVYFDGVSATCSTSFTPSA